MYNYWKSNRNVILTAVALFVVSLTALLFFLTENPEGEHGELKANVVDSLTIKSQQEEEKGYRSFLDQYDHDGPLVVLGLDGYVEFSSWDFETVAGYRLDDVKEELIYSFIHPDDLGLFLGAVGKTLSTEAPVMMVGPYRLRDVKGEYRLQMASFYPLKKEHKVQSIIIAIRDITGDVEAVEPSYSEEPRYEPRSEQQYKQEYEVKGVQVQSHENSMEQTILPSGGIEEEIGDPNQEAREAQEKRHERREERRELKEEQLNPSSTKKQIRNTEDDGDEKRLIVENV